MRLAAGNDGDPRRTLQSVCFDVPPGAAKHLVPRRRQGGGVRHRGAGHESDARRGRQARAARAATPPRRARSPRKPATGHADRRSDPRPRSAIRPRPPPAHCRPVTNPKYRGPGVATRPGSAAAARRSMTALRILRLLRQRSAKRMNEFMKCTRWERPDGRRRRQERSRRARDVRFRSGIAACRRT